VRKQRPRFAFRAAVVHFLRIPPGHRKECTAPFAAHDRPRNWTSLVNADQAPEELKAVRACVARGRPLGTAPWVQAAAERLRLAFTSVVQAVLERPDNE
jgi:hypothetical protein